MDIFQLTQLIFELKEPSGAEDDTTDICLVPQFRDTERKSSGEGQEGESLKVEVSRVQRV